jgi:hypothetical protein
VEDRAAGEGVAFDLVRHPRESWRDFAGALASTFRLSIVHVANGSAVPAQIVHAWRELGIAVVDGVDRAILESAPLAVLHAPPFANARLRDALGYRAWKGAPPEASSPPVKATPSARPGLWQRIVEPVIGALKARLGS